MPIAKWIKSFIGLMCTLPTISYACVPAASSYVCYMFKDRWQMVTERALPRYACFPVPPDRSGLDVITKFVELDPTSAYYPEQANVQCMNKNRITVCTNAPAYLDLFRGVVEAGCWKGTNDNCKLPRVVKDFDRYGGDLNETYNPKPGTKILQGNVDVTDMYRKNADLLIGRENIPVMLTAGSCL